MAAAPKPWCNAATCPGLCAPAPEGFEVPFVGKLYLGVAAIESVLMLVLSAVLFAIHDPEVPTGQIYAALGAFCTLAQLGFSYDAVWSENVFQLFASSITGILFTFFVTWQVFHNPYTLGPAWTDIRYEVLGVKIAFQVVYLLLAKRVSCVLTSALH